MPVALAGREADTQAFVTMATRLRDDGAQQGMLVIGPRGVGKTVLLNRFEALAEQRAHCRTVLLEAQREEHFAVTVSRSLSRMLAQLKPSTRVLRRIRALAPRFGGIVVKDGASGLEFKLGTEGPHADELAEDFSELLIELGTIARASATAAIFLFDELDVIPTSELGPLLTALHRANQMNLPVGFVGAGLPSLPAHVADARRYAERMHVMSIDRLKRLDAMKALALPARQRGVEYEDAALAYVVAETAGYPFFIQEYGRHIWEEAAGPVIHLEDATTGGRRAQEALDRSFFETRLTRTTEDERRYLVDMSKHGPGPCLITSLERRAWRFPWRSRVAVRQALIDKGLAYAPGDGLLDYTVPRFGEFLHRRFA